MVAGPNVLVLKKVCKRHKFEICFKFGLKIKKINGARLLAAGSSSVVASPAPPQTIGKIETIRLELRNQ